MQRSSNLILIGGIIIISFGVVNAIHNNRPTTPVFVGGIGVVLLASLLDALGGGWSKLAKALVGLTVVTVVIVEGPALFQSINNAQSNETASSKQVQTGGQPPKVA